MDYPLPETNWICRFFGHRYGKLYRDRYGPEDQRQIRQTCPLDGKTIPPFRKVEQYVVAEGEDPYLPDDQQPFGAA